MEPIADISSFFTKKELKKADELLKKDFNFFESKAFERIEKKIQADAAVVMMYVKIFIIDRLKHAQLDELPEPYEVIDDEPDYLD